MSKYKICFCVGAERCADRSCSIVKEYIEKYGLKHWKSMLSVDTRKDSFNLEALNDQTE